VRSYSKGGGAIAALVFLATFSTSLVAADQKKSAAPAPAHPAAAAPTAAGAHPAAPGASGAAHGPTTSSGSPGITTSGSHGATTGGASASHAITTSGSHGPTTSTSTSRGVTSTEHANSGAHEGAAAGGERAQGGGNSFAGHPAPAGSHEVHAANGAAVRTRADGSRSDIHDPKRGMDIHHGLNGSRQVSVERADHSRIVADRAGHGYVQHPYSFHGHEFGHRTYFDHGRAYDRFYGRYGWHGAYFDVYAPARFYPYGFYGYAYAPWAVPVAYPWGWAGAPWYGFYGVYYAPYPVYPAPAFWLADFIIAANLQAAYAAQATGAADLSPVPSSPPSLLEASVWLSDLLISPAEADAKPAMTPEVKDLVANEIKALVQQEGNEAQGNAAHQDADPAKNSVVQLLSDNHPHVFVAGSDLDLVASSGQECAFSQGDVLKVASPPPASGTNESATVLASKGSGKECAPSTSVTVALSDLQEMYNHMREQVDDGLGELQSKQGKSGIPAAPAGATGAPVQADFAAGAPPPDADAGKQINQQASQADQAESEASATAAAAPASGASGGGSKTIAIGQSIDVVTGQLGNPTKIIDLGAKKIYTYPDMKIIFMNGKVSDVQ
jgi:hypothetical protein